jgi:hypothetical protein
VRATDGRVGRVDEFLVDPESGNITHLCLRKDHLWGDKLVCIPVSEIDLIEGKGRSPEGRQEDHRSHAVGSRETATMIAQVHRPSCV